VLRDRTAAPRVLLVEEDHERRTRQGAVAIATRWPQARVTVLARHGEGNSDAPGARGVEVVRRNDVETALSTCRYQYSVVVVPAIIRAERWAALRDSQPQALVAILATDEASWASDSPPVPAARLLLAMTSEQCADPRVPTPAVALGCSIDPQCLEDALSYVGFAPAR
jgi:hypothetical protein